MPRMGRVVLPNYPHHIVQRGHNRQVVFMQEEDFRRYLADLKELKEVFGVRVYAYCLMTNHVHLLLEPGESMTGLGQLMKTLAARMTRYRNRLEGRSGTLWESRYKSSVVQTDAYLLACCRYIELNPVRARMVERPDHYPWSSYRARIGAEDGGGWLDCDPCYLGLADTEKERRVSYMGFVTQAIPETELKLIREALQRGQLTGNAKFIEEVERVAGRRVELRGQGRPLKGK
ncbi:transposase [Pseudomonas cavernicola]|uniref:Transposase n=1 Tax=Pseudomonas cavernicola TaxID=2320866 RepID=A0A418XHX4_9PSED|nr:transposase [Pseudomonas cavernicola]RJG12041.1 transposase [Pseudomonas cavernicola]